VWLQHKIEKKYKKKTCSDHDLGREWGIYNVLEEIQNNLGGVVGTSVGGCWFRV